MAKGGPKTDGSGVREKRLELRLSTLEQAQIEAVRAARGDDYASDAIRAIGQVWQERQLLLRAGLEILRGRYSAGEIGLILDVQNGTFLGGGIDAESGLPDVQMLGQHVAASVYDADNLAGKWEVESVLVLARRLRAEPRVALIALELWCAWLWAHSSDDALWERERAWLASPAV